MLSRAASGAAERTDMAARASERFDSNEGSGAPPRKPSDDMQRVSTVTGGSVG